MYRLGIPLIPQELLGYHLGLIVDKKDRHLFWNARTGRKPKTGYGTQISEKRYNANTVFKRLRVPLQGVYYPIDQFETKEEIVSFISDAVQKDKNILVFLKSGVLNGNKRINGHACVVDRVYPRRNIVRLIDPSSKQSKWREITIDRLIKAMKLHPTGKGRFWELKKSKGR